VGKVSDIAEALWNEKTDTYTYHPFGQPWGIEQIRDGIWFFKGFANTIFRETEDGLIIIDPAASFDSKFKYDGIRSVTRQRLNTAVFTHGHVDHVFGIPDYAKEATENGWPLPVVIAHEAMPARFRRYRESVQWNGYINRRQFLGGEGEPIFPGEYYYPDRTYKDHLEIAIGGVTVFLHHARGETDDHTWVFFEDQRLLCTGDLFIWSIPNCGNPQKVQRYAKEWAVALREMSALEPDILLPGHGFPIIGADRVKTALNDTAAFLESILEQTLKLMNTGASLETVIHSVKVPEELAKRPYLQPVYDESEFIIRNIWRFYGGWYDGVPSRLKPAPEKELALEISNLAGGSKKLAARATELSDAGNHRLACHLAEWAYLGASDDKEICKNAAKVFLARAKSESSTMSIGIYLDAAKQMDEESGNNEHDHKRIKAQAHSWLS